MILVKLTNCIQSKCNFIWIYSIVNDFKLIATSITHRYSCCWCCLRLRRRRLFSRMNAMHIFVCISIGLCVFRFNRQLHSVWFLDCILCICIWIGYLGHRLLFIIIMHYAYTIILAICEHDFNCLCSKRFAMFVFHHANNIHVLIPFQSSFDRSSFIG